MMFRIRSQCFFLFLILALGSGPLGAQQGGEPSSDSDKESAEAVTTADPEVPTDHLGLLLEPLTRDELLTEVIGWRDLAKAKLQEIADEGIAARKTNEEISEAAADPAISETEESQKIEEKEETLDTLNQSREEKAALLQRLSIVLDEYEAKGGDSEEYRQYISAVMGMKLEGADAASVWAAFRGWITSKEGGIKFAIHLAKFLGILLVFWAISGIVGRVVRRATELNRGMSDLLKKFLNKIIRRTILAVGILVGLGTMGVNVSAMLALMGGGAFVIGFALQDTLANFAAGLMLLIYRPFDVGNIVEVGGVSGKVDGVSLVSTTIRTFDNKVILVPNKSVWGEVITNSTASAHRRVDLVFGIGYEDDMKQAQEILERVVSSHESVLKVPETVIKVHELADSSVNFICRPWCKTDDYWEVYWDLTRKVKEEFDANGVSIPFPQQDVHMHQVEAASPPVDA